MFIGILALVGGLFAVPASAQAMKATIKYIVPQDLDPPSFVTFRRDGETRTSDDQGTPLTGRVLIENGAEIHGQVYTGRPNFKDIVEFHMLFSPFAGEVEILPESRFGFRPWRVIEESDGPERLFRFIKRPGSAPINDGFDPSPDIGPDQSFGLITASVENDPGGLFASASFTFQAFTTYQAGAVPEPGPLALGAGLLIGGLPLIRRLRRQ